MRTTIRTGVALSVAGLAAGGVMALASATPAQAATAAAPGPICPYYVAKKPYLDVWSRKSTSSANGNHMGKVLYGYVVYARKCKEPTGWVKIRQKDKFRPINYEFAIKKTPVVTIHMSNGHTTLDKGYVKRHWLARF